MFAEEVVDVFQRKAREERKAGASIEAGFMRRKGISYLRVSAFIGGSKFPKQFIDTEISAPKIKYHKYNKYWAQER